MTAPLAAALKALALHQPLDATETAAAFDVLMRGEATAAQTAALLMGLRVRGETAAEVAGAAQAMRTAMRHIVVADPSSVVDTCGTGGGSLGTFNISTAAAFLAAGAGARVAKHGNRSFTSACGSADVLEALGIAIELPVESLPQIFADAGIVFMYAPAMHPAMRHVGPIRRELAIPTVMNIVGPLANPASAGRQVVGVADRARVPLIAGALQALGSVHAMVVHGAPGIDEISPLGLTDVCEISAGGLREWTIDPARYGLLISDPTELAGAMPAENAQRIEEVLNNAGPAGARSAVVLNAAGALYVGGLAPTYDDAVTLATEALQAGRGAVALATLRTATQRATA